MTTETCKFLVEGRSSQGLISFSAAFHNSENTPYEITRPGYRDRSKKNKEHLPKRLPSCWAGEVSAPRTMSMKMIHAFIISKFNWIKKQQEKLRAHAHEISRNGEDPASLYFQGQRYLLQIVECDAAPVVSVSPSHLILQVRPNTPEAKRRMILDAWYGRQLKEQVGPLMMQWEKKMGVSVSHWTIRKMNTRWGSCTPAHGSIRLSLELAKKPLEHLEYVVVHELVHLLEPSHNKRFVALMDQFLPNWRLLRDELNHRSPTSDSPTLTSDQTAAEVLQRRVGPI